MKSYWDSKEKCAKYLTETYPGKTLIDMGDEMIVEVEPGFAVAAILRSKPHFHRYITEHYRVIKGYMTVVKAGKAEVACYHCDQEVDIEPLVVHSAVGIDGWVVVEVRSDPPWDPEDHFLV
jgi:hypothetical protein